MVTDEEFKKLKVSVRSLESRMTKVEADFGRISDHGEAPTLKSSLVIDVTGLSIIKELKTVMDKCLLLLDYMDEEYHQNPKLTTDLMREIFAERFGLTTITVNSISMALKEVTGEYVGRERILEGKTEKFQYWILPPGKEYIRKLTGNLRHVGVGGESEVH